MKRKLNQLITSDGLKAKTLRSMLASVWLAGGGQLLRFASNLILTRLLFPEAFGLMALVQVIVSGVIMISDVGLRAAVIQNPRGTEPAFLNTIWTFQIIRGFVLWIVVCGLAAPFAQLYNLPDLALILPVAGFSLVIRGFNTTNVLSVQRDLQLWRHSSLTLIAQLGNIICICLLAYWMESVWALVIGMLINPILALILYARYLPGIRNTLCWDRSAVRDIFNLGKFLTLSTISAYIMQQSDRAVLGTIISVDLLGIYGIAFVLASLPITLATKIAGSVLLPLYTQRHPSDRPENRRNIFRLRRIIAAGSISLIGAVALSGPWLIDVLYDPRYAYAGPIVVLLAAALTPRLILFGMTNAALAKGDSFRFMLVNVSTAALQLSLLLVIAPVYGIAGAAMAIGLAPLLTYPVTVSVLRKYKSWDMWGDAVLFASAGVLMGFALWLHQDKIAALMAAA